MRIFPAALALILATVLAPSHAIEGLVSRAQVTGPRGTFVAEMISLADGTTRFVQTYPADDPRQRGRVEFLVIAQSIATDRAFQRNEKGEFVAAPAGVASFVLGHDAVRRALADGSRPEKLSLPAPAEMGGGTVTIEYGDYRKRTGFELPFMATFTHSAAPGDHFVYRYTELLPFRVAPGPPAPNVALQSTFLFERLGDLAAIARAHEHVLATHRASDAELLTADSAVPMIALSDDGTLAWLACEIEAEGERNSERKSEPLNYAFSWVQLYARDPGAQGEHPWRAIGNASSQRP